MFELENNSSINFYGLTQKGNMLQTSKGEIIMDQHIISLLNEGIDTKTILEFIDL